MKKYEWYDYCNLGKGIVGIELDMSNTTIYVDLILSVSSPLSLI